MKPSAFAFFLFCLLWPALGLSQEAPAQKTRRYAMVIGSNDGGDSRARLRYGTTDAEAFSQVLQELGGVQPTDSLLLLDPDRLNLEAGFDTMQDMLKRGHRADTRQELVVYYSGHSDDQGLLLFGEHYPYSDLRQSINGLPADVRIAILDSCASGAVTRTKGGVRRPAFLVDEASSVKGYAFLTSASESEAAQESDNIGASFFTHYLISGLRGAADVTRDGQVTLNEAYQFAFHETLARTETSRAGAQHPAYDMQLSGTGDLVLTDLRATSASLVVAQEVDGRLYVRDQKGKLVAELFKPAGRAVELGLAEGTYQITLDKQGQLQQASVSLARGRSTTLASNDLSDIVSEVTRARGDEPAPEAAPEPGPSSDQGFTPALELSLVPGLSLARLTHQGNDHMLAINMLVGAGHDLNGFEVGGLSNWRSGQVRGAQVAGIGNYAEGGLQGGQISGIFNISGGRTRGLQISGLFNLAQEADLLTQISGLFNLSQTPAQGQIGGVFNLSRGDAASHFQLAGVFNLHQGQVQGLQLAGVLNGTRGDVHGAQVGGVINVAGGHVHGLQLGVVNYASKVTGTQVGLINLSEDADAPIGLFNFSRNGLLHARAWASDFYPVNVGVQLGGRYTYTLLGYGWRPGKEDDYHGFQIGLGGHIPLGERLYLELDGVVSTPQKIPFNDEQLQLLVRARASVGYDFQEHFGVFGGVAQNFFVQDSYLDRPELVPSYSVLDKDNGGYAVEVYGWPGLFAGVQF